MSLGLLLLVISHLAAVLLLSHVVVAVEENLLEFLVKVFGLVAALVAIRDHVGQRKKELVVLHDDLFLS